MRASWKVNVIKSRSSGPVTFRNQVDDSGVVKWLDSLELEVEWGDQLEWTEPPPLSDSGRELKDAERMKTTTVDDIGARQYPAINTRYSSAHIP